LDSGLRTWDDGESESKSLTIFRAFKVLTYPFVVLANLLLVALFYQSVLDVPELKMEFAASVLYVVRLYR